MIKMHKELNREIFDVKDPNELHSLMLAMKLQSETLPEIDGVPLNAFLANLEENQRGLGMQIMNGSNLNPDEMTYEVILYKGKIN